MRYTKTRRRKGRTGLGWWQPWMQIWEIAVAAPEVVAHRTARMAKSGATRSSADRRELTRMTQEKFEAFRESASAMATEIVRANLALWPSVLRARKTLPSVMWMPTRRAASFASKSALAAGAVPRIVSNAASHVLAEGLAPVHRRATANAKRLRRTPR
jgi:hypothetical protein